MQCEPTARKSSFSPFPRCYSAPADRYLPRRRPSSPTRWWTRRRSPLLLLSLGWNFSFTAATALIVHTYTPAERDATQGATNFIIYGFVAALLLSSGALVHYFGWKWVNLGALPLLAIAGAVTFWYSASGLHKPLTPSAAE